MNLWIFNNFSLMVSNWILKMEEIDIEDIKF